MVLFMLCSMNLNAQNVAVNNDGSLPNANAILDIKSSNKGILIPRIDYNNRPTGISVPAGLLVFVTANGPLGNNAYYFYDGTSWLREKNSTDVQTLSMSNDTLTISQGNSVVVGTMFNLIGYYKCNTTYTQIASDNNNCGSCGHVCSLPNGSSYCSNSTCYLNTCNSGFANCDNLSFNGCEINLNTDPNNCGTCAHVCSLPNATAGCSGGNCTIAQCSTGFANCDAATANGCEINLMNSITNCGTCGHICNFQNATSNCIAGACGLGFCNSGFANCDNNAGNGCETYLVNNPYNCGSCGNVCAFPNASSNCVNSACALGNCNSGYGNCDGNPGNGCEIYLGNNPFNCGSCGNVCSFPNASANCVNSTCAIGNCNFGYANCDGNPGNGCETSILSNNNNCGSCGHVCGFLQSCVNGACQ